MPGTSCFPLVEDTQLAPQALSGQVAAAPSRMQPQAGRSVADGEQQGSQEEESSPKAASWQERVEEQKAEQLAKAEAASQSKLEQRVVNWDMRRLAAERLRAETGADLAHGAAIGEEIRIHKHIVEQNLARVQKIKDALAHVPTGVDEKMAVADTAASKAGDVARATGILLKGAKASIGPSLAVTRRKAINLIKQRTQELAHQEATAYAERMDWDKPDTWKRILAMRASVPYAKAMVDSAQRFSQYRAAARHTLNEAWAIQADAVNLSPQVESFKEHGEIPSAVEARSRIQTLQKQSAGMKNQAQRYWRTSEDAWKSMSEWQAASFAAAEYVARVYDTEHTAVKS